MSGVNTVLSIRILVLNYENLSRFMTLVKTTGPRTLIRGIPANVQMAY